MFAGAAAWRGGYTAGGVSADGLQEVFVAQGPLAEQGRFKALALAGVQPVGQAFAIHRLPVEGGVAQLPVIGVVIGPGVGFKVQPGVVAGRRPWPRFGVFNVVVLHGQGIEPDQGRQHPVFGLKQGAAVASFENATRRQARGEATANGLH